MMELDAGRVKNQNIDHEPVALKDIPGGFYCCRTGNVKGTTNEGGIRILPSKTTDGVKKRQDQ